MVLRFIKKKVIGCWYPHLGAGELRLSTISDAAFRALVDESAGLALRGYIVLLTREKLTSPAGPDGTCHVLDVGCRRQKRVVRSAFAAEINGVVDSMEACTLIHICMREICVGDGGSPESLMNTLEGGGRYPPQDLTVDARSVCDACASQDPCKPSEESLVLHVLAIRSWLENKRLRALFWGDTREMLAGGLTKGGVGRTLLNRACHNGHYALALGNHVRCERRAAGATKGGV